MGNIGHTGVLVGVTCDFNEYLRIFWEYAAPHYAFLLTNFQHGYQFLDYTDCSNITGTRTTYKHAILSKYLRAQERLNVTFEVSSNHSKV